MLQPLALVLELAGETMRPRLFIVQSEGSEELALRADFTIGLVQTHLQGPVRPGRYLYEGKIFRAAAGTARAEEFLQIGIEAFGDADAVAADAEIAGLAWQSARAGGRGDLFIQFGDIALFGAFIDSLELAPLLAARLKRVFSRPRLLQAELEGRDRAGETQPNPLAGVSDEQAVVALTQLWSMAGVQPVGGRPPEEIARRLTERAEAARAPHLSPAEAELIRDYLRLSGQPSEVLDAIGKLAGPGRKALEAATTDWSFRLTAMKESGVPLERLTLSTAFGRAFGYYDGVLFEVLSKALDSDRAVAAGGRYDGLLARLGGGSIGAVGCMVRPARASVTGGE